LFDLRASSDLIAAGAYRLYTATGLDAERRLPSTTSTERSDLRPIEENTHESAAMRRTDTRVRKWKEPWQQEQTRKA
jgi:hypothetical protein